MGEARDRKALGLPPRGLKAFVRPKVQDCLTLAAIDRRIIQGPDGETRFEDHSAKPGVYASPNLKSFYHWDGIAIRRLDSNPFEPQTTGTPA